MLDFIEDTKNKILSIWYGQLSPLLGWNAYIKDDITGHYHIIDEAHICYISDFHPLTLECVHANSVESRKALKWPRLIRISKEDCKNECQLIEDTETNPLLTIYASLKIEELIEEMKNLNESQRIQIQNHFFAEMNKIGYEEMEKIKGKDMNPRVVKKIILEMEKLQLWNMFNVDDRKEFREYFHLLMAKKYVLPLLNNLIHDKKDILKKGRIFHLYLKLIQYLSDEPDFDIENYTPTGIALTETLKSYRESKTKPKEKDILRIILKSKERSGEVKSNCSERFGFKWHNNSCYIDAALVFLFGPTPNGLLNELEFLKSNAILPKRGSENICEKSKGIEDARKLLWEKLQILVKHIHSTELAYVCEDFRKSLPSIFSACNNSIDHWKEFFKGGKQDSPEFIETLLRILSPSRFGDNFIDLDYLNTIYCKLPYFLCSVDAKTFRDVKQLFNGESLDNYKLVSILVFKGGNHYTCYIRCENDWYYYNDMNAEKMPFFKLDLSSSNITDEIEKNKETPTLLLFSKIK